MIGVDPRKTHGAARSRTAGFTLLEMVVVLGLFSMTVATAADIFMMASNAQRRAFFMERSQADARFSVEALVREVRNGKIDYEYYGGMAPVWSESLALIDETGSKMLFRKSDATTANICADGVGPCVIVVAGNAPPAAVTPKGVKVRNLRFYLAPAIDAETFNTLTQEYVADMQQRVTAVMIVENPVVKANEQASLNYIQATAAGRQYRR